MAKKALKIKIFLDKWGKKVYKYFMEWREVLFGERPYGVTPNKVRKIIL